MDSTDHWTQFSSMDVALITRALDELRSRGHLVPEADQRAAELSELFVQRLTAVYADQ